MTGAVCAVALLLPATASAHHGNPVQVAAAGNPFTGALAFDPADVAPEFGRHVRWTNTDQYVPHTVTEENGLWELTGDYGAPGLPSGFGPGEYRERHFEAGTHRYFCRVHPEMRGSVAVAPALLEEATVAELQGRKRKYGLVRAMWNTSPPADGLVYDAEFRRGSSGPWKPLRTGTRTGERTFRTERKRKRWYVRARLRRASDGAATGWSPASSIKN